MKIIHHGIRFNKVILRLVLSDSFLMLTFFGNFIIIGFSLLLYAIEAKKNPAIQSVLDSVWWGFATATSVGYGDIIPITDLGKLIGIVLMLVGTALFATYTALFAQTVLEDEFFRLKLKPQLKEENPDDFISDLKKHKDLIDKQIKHYEGRKKD